MQVYFEVFPVDSFINLLTKREKSAKIGLYRILAEALIGGVPYEYGFG